MIVGETVRLRPVERGDLPHFVDWFNDPEVRHYIDKYLPCSLAQEKRWFEQLQERIERQEVVMFTIETMEGIAIGNISLFDIDWKNRRAELAITIGDKDYWGQGYGSDAIWAMLRVGFDSMNLHRIFLRVHSDNARAIQSYKKAGFRKEGTLRDDVFQEGCYLDMYVMGILASEYSRNG